MHLCCILMFFRNHTEFTIWVCGVCSIKWKHKTRLHEVRVLLGIHPSNYFQHQFDVKMFCSCQCQRPVKENAKVISLSKTKLQRVKQQQPNGAIFPNHINAVKTNSHWRCAPPLSQGCCLRFFLLIRADNSRSVMSLRLFHRNTRKDLNTSAVKVGFSRKSQGSKEQNASFSSHHLAAVFKNHKNPLSTKKRSKKSPADRKPKRPVCDAATG